MFNDSDIKKTCQRFVLIPHKWLKPKKSFLGIMYCQKSHNDFLKTDLAIVRKIEQKEIK